MKKISRWFRSLRPIALILSRRAGRIGKGSFISPSAQILGWRSLSIGKNCVISDHVCFNINNRKIRPSISIGDNVFIAQNCFFSSGEKIEISSFCLIGRSCQFLNAGHQTNPLLPYAESGIRSYAPMKIGTNVWLTNQIMLLGAIEIGFGAIIHPGSHITENIPPLCTAAGSPAKIVKFYRWSEKKWSKFDPNQSFEKQLEDHLTQLPTLEEYFEHIRRNSSNILLPKVAAGSSVGDLY